MTGEQLDVEVLARQIVELLAEREPSPPLMTAEQAAEVLGVPASWVLAEARAERVPHVRLGRYVRFDGDELRRWAADGHHCGPRPRGRK